MEEVEISEEFYQLQSLISISPRSPDGLQTPSAVHLASLQCCGPISSIIANFSDAAQGVDVW